MTQKYPGGIISKTAPTPAGPYESSAASGIWTLEQQAYWNKLGQWPTAGNKLDFQFNYVTLLLHGDGTNGAQNNTFLDSSTNNFTITRNGNTTQGSFSPYGSNWSNNFSTSALILPSSSALNAGTGNFTIEAWIFPSSGGYLTGTSGGTLVFAPDCNDGFIRLGRENVAFDVEVNAGVVKNKWQHVAISRSGTTVYVFLDGVLKGTGTSSESYTLSTSHIGMGGTNYIGYASNFRFVVGTALYTSGFTPSTTPLTAVSGTALLTCQSNRFKDNSSNNLTLTPSGTPTVQRFNPFGTAATYSTSVIGGSGYFDGNGDFLSAPANAVFSFGTGDFTIEGWVYPTGTNTGAPMPIVEIRTNATNTTGFAFMREANALTLNVYQNGYKGASTNSLRLNAWNHVALVRSGNTWAYWINGVASGSFSNSTNLTDGATTGPKIGGSTTAGEVWIGYMTDVRLVKGTAVYTSAFTPNTAPLTAISGTSLLLSYINGAIFDNAMMNDLETVGNAQISTSVKKYGTGSIYLDGTGDYLVGNGFQGLGGDFTIEAWVYSLNWSSGAHVIFDTRDAWFSATGVNLYFNDAGNLIMYLNSGDRITSATAYSLSTWYHVALVRSGSTITMYVDGTSVGTYTYATALTDKTAIVGTATDNRQTTNAWKFNGYIDDLRITSNFARYTSTFTPPTAAFPNLGPNG